MNMNLKKHLRTLLAAVVVSSLFASQAAFAGDCCTKAAKAAKKGKTCAACETADCCKKAVQAVADAGQAKPCKKCAKKAKGSASRGISDAFAADGPVSHALVECGSCSPRLATVAPTAPATLALPGF